MRLDAFKIKIRFLSKFIQKLEYFIENKKIYEEYIVLGKVYNRRQYFELLRNWEIESVV